MSATLSRREFAQGMGAVVVGFSLAAPARRARAKPEQPEDPKWSADEQRELTPDLDGWIRIAEDGSVTFFTGRVEIGNGILTALSQVVADELDVPFERVAVIAADTDLAPNQGVTSATTTIGVAAVVIRQAAATARQATLDLAAEALGAPVSNLQVRDGVVSSRGGAGRALSYGELIGGRRFERKIDAGAPLKSPESYQIVGQPVPRIDIPAKVTGAADDFGENVRVEGMAFAWLLRAPAYGARLVSYVRSVAELPGVVAVIPIRHPGDPRLARVERLVTMPGDFVAVVAEREDQAIAAVERLRDGAEWETGDELPVTDEGVYDWLLKNGKPVELIPIGDPGTRRETFDEILARYETRLANAADTYTAAYRGPHLSHAPMSPAWALADVRGDRATVWSATQWPFGARWMVAEALGFEDDEQVRVIGGSGSGLYGRREEYDQEVDVEAALVSQAVRRTVRLQWSHADEFVWGPFRPPQIVELTAALDGDHRVAGLRARIHTAVRASYPAPGLAAMALQDAPYVVGPLAIEAFDAGPLLRTGYMHNVFSGSNMFALESFMDEMAARAGEDPVAYRLHHLEDQRAIAVIEEAAALAGWRPSGGRGGTGMGLSFVLYTNEAGPSSAYMAYVAAVDVDAASGAFRVTKVSCAIDAGLAVNPDGVKNQVEGGVIQAMSWAMKEQVAFDRRIVTSRDWATYPILTFPETTEIEVVVVDRPDQPAKGIGEPVTVPVAGAIANAIRDATGARVRELPLTPERVKHALAGG